MAFSPRRVSREWEIDAPASLVWDTLAHTDKLNRAVGLPPVQPGSLEGDDLGRKVETRLYGFLPMSWIEYPFEWVRDRQYSVQRDYVKGPLVRFRGGVDVVPSGAGSLVRIYAEATPRNFFGALAVPFIGRDALRKTWDYCRKVIEHNRSRPGAPESTAAPVSRASSGSRTDRALLAQRAARLGQIPSLNAHLVDRLVRHLAVAGDEDVVRMQPYALALRWKTDRRETLRVFLYATRAGLLDLVWDLMCPNCRVPKGEAESLALVTKKFHCDTCGIDYEANLDRYVELRFRVNPGIRSAQDHVYCFGGPYSAPHIQAQHLLRPGEQRDLSTTLQPEPYRIRTLRTNETSLLLPASGQAPAGPDAAFAYGDGGWEKKESFFRPGPVRVQWTNRSAKTVGVVLELVRWDELAVTAAEVTAMQEFRDLFGSEVLAPGQDIGIESVTILFSDLKGSTRLYEETGDAPAYGQVRRHFDFLKERITRCRGAVVKTIGDAVMAVFSSPADAVRCCLAIQRDIGPFNQASQASSGQPPLTIKLGAHDGPAIAINANGRLDYFGRTVNIASRILRESQGGDVVLAKETIEDPRVREVLEHEQASVVEEWRPTLRGLAEPLTLCRIRRS